MASTITDTPPSMPSSKEPRKAGKKSSKPQKPGSFNNKKTITRDTKNQTKPEDKKEKHTGKPVEDRSTRQKKNCSTPTNDEKNIKNTKKKPEQDNLTNIQKTKASSKKAGNSSKTLSQPKEEAINLSKKGTPPKKESPIKPDTVKLIDNKTKTTETTKNTPSPNKNKNISASQKSRMGATPSKGNATLKKTTNPQASTNKPVNKKTVPEATKKKSESSSPTVKEWINNIATEIGLTATDSQLWKQIVTIQPLQINLDFSQIYATLI